jgi:PAS domain S-box-containing protein
MVRSAGDAIISIDRRGSITGWNPAAERIFGWSAREAVGRSLRGMFPDQYEQAARQALTGMRPASSFDLSAKRADGKMLNLAVTLSGVPGREGRVEGLLAIVRDMTSQRELETQMHQSEKLTALGQVAGGIAHDFNNLLQAILGYSQLMSKNLQNIDVVRRGLSVIETAAVGGAETVRRIQKFARLRPDEPFVSVELNQVVHDSVAITRPRWEERVAKGGVPLRLDLRLTPLPTVMGRPSELNEVITNLILNAIDAMPQGGTLGIYTRPEGDEHVVLSVADTGVGMPEHVRKRIFDPFFTTKGEVGTGLGLSVSYSIIQRHGGEMRAESQPGRGTTFTIVLPVGTAEKNPPPADSEALGTRRGRILLVDNELPVMTVLGEMLTEVGHHVLPVASGAEAVRVFVPGGFDLVMTNLGMTGLTGWDVAERVRASDPHVAVIFITGWGLQAEDRERCRKLGVLNVLFKPVRPNELHQAVQEALAVSTRAPGSAS